MIAVIESPNTIESVGPELRHHDSVFMAGGITDCPNWQVEAIEYLARCDAQDQNIDLILLNPRRADFPIGDPSAAEKQITWEHNHLLMAGAILFWFPEETLCPIVLYELGTWSRSRKPIFVGVHPKYQRRQDVEIQTRLARPDVEVVYSLEDLLDQVVDWDRR